MGKRGPRKTPTALRLLRGNPSGRKIPANEPAPAPLSEHVQAPDWLDEPARREWDRTRRSSPATASSPNSTSPRSPRTAARSRSGTRRTA